MDNILKKLYEGELHPEEELIPKSEAYMNQRAKTAALEKAFCLTLDAAALRAYEEITGAKHVLAGIELEDAYIQGMKMGARLSLALLDGGKGEDEFEP